MIEAIGTFFVVSILGVLGILLLLIAVSFGIVYSLYRLLLQDFLSKRIGMLLSTLFFLVLFGVLLKIIF